jgi:hypothetical protein
MSSTTLFELLSNVCLNLPQPHGTNAKLYSITAGTTDEQRELLRALGLQELLDDKAISARITPR